MRSWKRAPYAVPAAAVLAIAAGAGLPRLSGASDSPALSPQTAQQLVASVVSAQPPQLSGTVTWTANLGLSDLTMAESDLSGGGGNSSAFNPLSLLSGSYSVSVWLDGSQAEHLSLSTQPGEEVDFVRNGNQAWAWDSATEKVTQFTWTPPSSSTEAPSPALTPDQLAAKILDNSAATTSVTPDGTAYVAGEPAYLLRVAPKDATGSTIDHVELAVGSSAPLSGAPLQVSVYAVGQQSPALQVGYTGAIQPGPPPANELTFTPPPGSTVTQRQISPPGSGNGGGFTGWTGYAPLTQQSQPQAGTENNTGSGVKTVGSGWTAVAVGNAGNAFSGANAQSALDAATTVVNVGTQQGRLFTSSLVNVLLMPDGHFYAGLVQPSVLESVASTGA